MRGLKKHLGILLALLSLLAASNTPAQGATADQYLAAGNQMYTARNYTQALQYLNAAIKLNPSDPRAYQLAGNCYYGLGNKAYALSYYQRASALQPNNTQLAQFVQNLRAQVGSGTAAGAAAPAADPLAQGSALFKQRQYAAAIPYFQQATQQNPNDYRGYYYAGYSYYMLRDGKDAALYFGVANAKQPNASIKAYADRIKASLSPEDQQWVDDQVAKYSQGGGAVAGGGKKKKDMAFGINLLGGMDLILSTQTQVEQYHPASMAITGVAPTQIMAFGIEPYLQFGEMFELDLAFNYIPVGQWYYTTYDYALNNINLAGAPDVWKYTYNMTVITANLGGKILFGGKDVKGYLGLNAGISPISMTFQKLSLDQTYSPQSSTDASSGNYSTMALSANAKLGVDFFLGSDIAIGPYVGFQYLSATNFTAGGKTLVVDTKNGAVGVPDTATASSNMPATDPTTPFQFDFTGITGGLDITFSF